MNSCRLLPLLLLAAIVACSDEGSSEGAETSTSGSTGGGSVGPDSTTDPSTGGPSTGESSGGSTADSTVGTTGDGGTTQSTSSSEGSGSTGGEACAATVFVNFDGVTLSSGQEDATNDVTSNSELAIELPPYDGTQDPDAVVAVVRQHVAPFDVCVTRDRPAQGPYTMVVVTEYEWMSGILGVSPLDCGNGNPSNVSFVFTAMAFDVSPRALANVITAEFAVTIGLESQTSDVSDLLCRGGPCIVDLDVDRSFVDACVALPFGASCAAQHEVHCDPESQNSFQEMLATFGPA